MDAPSSYFYGQSALVLVKRATSVDILLSYFFRLNYEEKLFLSTKRATYFNISRDFSAV